MQTSTSLTFFIAIFVAFSGALVEELMIFCWHVRTELYYIDPVFQTHHIFPSMPPGTWVMSNNRPEAQQLIQSTVHG